MTRPIIVLDPGHGGFQTAGGSSPNNAHGPNGLQEKDLTLDLARRAAGLLATDMDVVLTRSGDSNLGLSERARIARDRQADIFLSIHLNGFTDPSVDGTELWTARSPSRASQGLARLVLEQLLAVTGVKDRGVREKNFGVLLASRHAPNTAASLAEIAFLSNPAQARRLEDDGYRQRLAAALAAGVRRALEPAAAQGLALDADSLLSEDALKKAVDHNEKVLKGKIPKVGAEVIAQAQSFLGVGLIMPYKNGPGWRDILRELSLGVAAWQKRQLLTVDGHLTLDTVKAMKAHGLKPTPEERAQRDREEHKAIRDEEERLRQRVRQSPGAAATRQAIVDLARSQVGKVFSSDRGDGAKYGWERIARYYEQAYGSPDAYFQGQRDASGNPNPGSRLADIKAANKFLGDSRAPAVQAAKIAEAEKKKGGPLSDAEKEKIRKEHKHVENWSWCAIFAIWAVRAITGRGVWTAKGPQGLGAGVTNDPMLRSARRGDMLHIKNSPQNHHVVLAQEVPADATASTTITTVEGNLDAQEIVYSTRWKVSDIDLYYPAVPDGAPATGQDFDRDFAAEALVTLKSPAAQPRPAQPPAEARPVSGPTRVVYEGQPFTSSNDATLFRCTPTPVAVAPATLLPAATTDPDPAIREALAAAGLSAAQIGQFEREGGLPPLRPFAEVFGGPALGEVMSRLRYTPDRFLSPPHTFKNEAEMRRALGVTHAPEILPARLLLAIPGHFRELARRAPDEREAHALECFGWLLMESVASRVAIATRKRWWLPTPPPFVSPFASTLPQLSRQVHQMVMSSMLIDTTLSLQDYLARFNTWSRGPAGHQWRLETGRDTSGGGPGRPFYRQAVPAQPDSCVQGQTNPPNIPAPVDISAQKRQIQTAWDTWVREVETRTGAGTEATTTTLRTCNDERVTGLRLISSASLGGLELTGQFPRLAPPAGGSRAGIHTNMGFLTALRCTFEHLMRTIYQLGWGDLLFQTAGSGCFRGNKVQGDLARRAAAARRISNHGFGIAVDLMVLENPQGQRTSTIDPRIVAIFEAFHFRWGRCFAAPSDPDPHHFEYCGSGCAPATGGGQSLEALAASIGGLGPLALEDPMAQPAPAPRRPIPPTCIPARPTDAKPGSALMTDWMDMDQKTREPLILAELEKGNIPGFLRRLKQVVVGFTEPDGTRHSAAFWVMPDYLAVGNDDDWVRVPLMAKTAQKIADKYCMLLPTAKMVESIFQKADIQLVAKTRWPVESTTKAYKEHNETIQDELDKKHPYSRGRLIAGHKKDVVITDRSWENRDGVPFYGFYDGNKQPIQARKGALGQATLGHTKERNPNHVDYSHGVRLVANQAQVDGQPMSMEKLLKDSVLFQLVYADEIKGKKQPMQNPPRLPF